MLETIGNLGLMVCALSLLVAVFVLSSRASRYFRRLEKVKEWVNSLNIGYAAPEMAKPIAIPELWRVYHICDGKDVDVPQRQP